MTDRAPLPWSEVPAAEQKRLRDREAAQRRETKARDLPALPISVEGLWMVQRGMCTCPECRGEVPLNPHAEAGSDERIVIAHVFYRAGKGSPGHVPHNVALWPSRCNRREARDENRARGRGNHQAVKKLLATDRKPERKSKSRGFSKAPAGYVSPLSKKHPRYQKGWN